MCRVIWFPGQTCWLHESRQKLAHTVWSLTLNPVARCGVSGCLYGECLQQLACNLEAIFFHDILCQCQRVSLLWFSTVTFNSQQWWFNGSITKHHSLYLSGFIIKHCQKKTFIHWLLALFKSAKKNDNKWNALPAHFIQAYWYSPSPLLTLAHT